MVWYVRILGASRLASRSRTVAPETIEKRRGRVNTIFTIIGYGRQAEVPRVMDEPVRHVAATRFLNMRSKSWTDGYNVQTSSNPALGGTCWGDSGGPVLFDETNIVGAVVSFGANDKCMGVDYHYRVDLRSSLDFITSFLD